MHNFSIEEFSRKYDKFFIHIISEYYPFDEYLLKKLGTLLNWERLSKNENINWSINLIELFEYKWDWKGLSKNKKIQFSEEQLERHKDELSWSSFSSRVELGYSSIYENWGLIFRKYSDKWDWKSLSNNVAIHEDLIFLKEYSHKWVWEDLLNQERFVDIRYFFDKNYFSFKKVNQEQGKYYYAANYQGREIDVLTCFVMARSFLGVCKEEEKLRKEKHWRKLCKEEFINKAEYLIYEEDFIVHSSFPMKLNDETIVKIPDELWNYETIEKYYENIDWKVLSQNEFVFWTYYLIEKFEDKWDWDSLSSNNNLPWTIDFIKKHETKWNWNLLSGNKGLPWCIRLIEEFYYNWRWEWGWHRIDWWEVVNNEHCCCLSDNISLPWSINFINKYENKLDWNALSSNESLPWSIELIVIYQNKWNWDIISHNNSLPWSIELIEKYQNRWNWEVLSCNVSLPWSIELIEKFKNRWSWMPISGDFGWIGTGLIWNKSLPWSIKLIDRYSHKWDLDYLLREFIYNKLFINKINDKLIAQILLPVKNDKNFNPNKGTPNNHNLIENYYYIFFDTETTGVPSDYNAPMNDLENWPRLVQIAWIACDEKGTIIESAEHIIKPNGFIIPKDAVSVHGISMEKANREGNNITEVLMSFTKLVRNSKFLVGHNVSFDISVVGAELIRTKMECVVQNKDFICTMKSSVNFCALPNKYSGYKLPNLEELYFKLFGKPLYNAHTAMADIKATKDCFFELKKRNIVVE